MRKTFTFGCLLLCLYCGAQENRQLQDSIPPIERQQINDGDQREYEVEDLKDRLDQEDEIEAPLDEVAEPAPTSVGNRTALERYRQATFPSLAGPDLLEAYALSDNKVDLLDEMMGYYEIMGDEASIQRVADKMRTTAKYHPSIMRYQDHLLQSIPDGSILITNGEWDSYPLICRSLVNEHEVVFVYLHLLSDPAYRGERLAQKGLQVPESGSGADFISRLAELNPDHGLYIGLTVPKDILRELRTSLHLNGLSLSYGQQVSMRSLQEQWEGAIDQDLSAETSLPIKVARLRLNYLPMLDTILRSMEADGDDENADRIRAQIDRILTQAGRPELKNRFK